MSVLSRIFKFGAPAPMPIPGSLTPSGGMQKIEPFQEAGVSGLLRTKGVGYVFEEWLASLSTYRQRQVYREMRDNDAVIGAMFFALEMELRQAQWSVEPAEPDNSKAQQYAEFIDGCMDDMSHTWLDLIAEIVNMFAFGFALFETVYKRRLGSEPGKFKDADGEWQRLPSSKFDDGLIGWRKHAPRAQESILYWDWDKAGGLQGAVQLAAPDYRTTNIPIEKLLLFRTTSIKNNPEGRSILRNCFRSWSFKKRLEEVEGIGIERDLCGMPVLYASAEAITAMGGEAKARKLITNIRIDDQMGVILPIAYDEKGNPLVKLELMKSGGSKQTKASDTIDRYNKDILGTLLAGFIQMGTGSVGSRSLHMSATQIFANAISAFMLGAASIINRIAIPRLMALNAMDLSLAPKVVPGDLEVRDLDEIGAFITSLYNSGITLNDPATRAALRKMGKLPPEPAEDTEDALDDTTDSGTDAPDAKPAGQQNPKDSSTPGSGQEAGDRLESAA